ncbi:MAG: RIP metalloprotease RseP [Deltaproteobacteria bacterium]|nr:RIP metalloprotease RseP [Deltaproteobacteria bacterium]
MYVLQNLHWVILLIGALVFFHELGHFIVAKILKVKVLKFSLGFGPRILGFKRGETEYVISLLPLGGFVKMLGETPGAEVAPEEVTRSFAAKPWWQRALIVVAGPTFNFILAFVVYCFMFTGTQTFGSTKLGIVMQGDPAFVAGLRPGDTITAINDEVVERFEQLRELIGNQPDKKLKITFIRNGISSQVELTTQAHQEKNIFGETETTGRIGISPQYVKPLLGVVDNKSPAAIAGLKTGDLVTKVAGKAIETFYELQQAILATASEQSIELTIKRSDKELQLSLMPQPTPEALTAYKAGTADTSWGYTGIVSQDVIVTRVDEETPAAKLGLKPGDRLLELRADKEDEQSTVRQIGVWNVDLAAFQGSDARQKFLLTYQRDRQVITAPLTLAEHTDQDELKNKRTQYIFGAYNANDLLGFYTIDRFIMPHTAILEALKQVVQDTTLIGKGITKMISGSLSIDTLGGPIMLFVIAEKSAKQGIDAFMRVLAVISVNLGVLNLLPIPVLDGGHLLFFGIEAVRRRPVPLHTRELANMIGLIILVLLMVVVLKNDFLRYVLG